MNSKSFTLSLVASLAATLVIAQDAAAPAAAIEKAGPGGAVCACGSLYMIGDVARGVREWLVVSD